MAIPVFNLNDALKIAMEKIQDEKIPLEVKNTEPIAINNQSVGITVNNFPLCQEVSFLGNSNIWINNRSAGITINNFPSGITVTNFPASTTVALAFDSNIWLNNRSAGITINNFPAIQNVSFPVPVQIIKQPLQYVMYTGIAGATISIPVNVNIATKHGIYIHWHGPRNGIKLIIEHNSTLDSMYPWTELYNANAPNGTDLRTQYQSFINFSFGCIRIRLTGGYSGGTVTIISVHN